MENRDTKEYQLFDAVTPVAVTSSTDATPIVVTATAHGLVTGDTVLIYGHTTNVAANGIYRVVRVDADSFQLKDVNTGASIAGTGGGAGSGGLLIPNPKVIDVRDYINAIVQFATGGTATLTVKPAGSLGKSDGSTPNFGATVSPTNIYTFLQAINLDTAAAVNGATGFAASGADIVNTYEININAMKYFTLIPTAWTQGAITARLLLTANS